MPVHNSDVAEIFSEVSDLLDIRGANEYRIRAMDNPYFNILAHPTGRLIGERDPYDVDVERIVEATKERGCYLELNASPHRLDLNDIYCKMTREMGVKIAISTDAHRTSELDFMRFGVWQAGGAGWKPTTC